MTKFGFSAPAAFLAVALWAAPASAATFDFAPLGSVNNTPLPHNLTSNGVEATAWADTANDGVFGAVILWQRRQIDDNGIGVCSEGASDCGSLGGNINELSRQANNEMIRLDKGTWALWTELWVSSLDGNGGVSDEEGILYWSNSGDPNQDFSLLPRFDFSFFDIAPVVEWDLLTLPGLPATFDASARYLFFAAGGDFGDDEDYLVWKGAVREGDNITPEPASLLLFGMGLLGAGVLRRRAR